MFKPVALYIGLRYTRAKRRNHFISFISFTSMIGIALGVAVLITVLSVMNGFDQAIRQHFFTMAQQITITTPTNQLTHWQKLRQQIVSTPQVIGIAPYIQGHGLLSANGETTAVVVYGIEPNLESAVSALPRKMIAGHLLHLQPGKFGIILGVKLAQNLGVSVGDPVNLVVPTATLTPVGILPRLRTFKVVGIFHIGNGFGYDDQLAYINLTDAQKLFALNQQVSGLQLQLKDMYQAPLLNQQLSQRLGDGYNVVDWTQTYGAFFQAVKLEKTMMFLMLILIVAVAAFNLVSTLVMMVTDKKSDIAILRTLGATPLTILAIFIIQGMLIGTVGVLLGMIGGVSLALHVTELVNGLQHLFHVHLVASDVYYTNYLPSKLENRDVWHITIIALLLCLVATLYPAWQASRTQPAEALRYD